MFEELLFDEFATNDFIVGRIDVRVAEGFVFFHLFERVELVSTAVTYIASWTGPLATENHLLEATGVGKLKKLQTGNEIFIDCVGYLIFRVLIGIFSAFLVEFSFKFDNTLIMLFEIDLWQKT